MRRRARPEPPRIEPPLWYRVFDPVSWDEPDAQEQRMMDGSRGCPWPEELHRWHSERRWHEAKHRYRQQNPALATQEFDDLVGEEARARRAERRAASGGSMEP